jgi:hypothetical protein
MSMNDPESGTRGQPEQVGGAETGSEADASPSPKETGCKTGSAGSRVSLVLSLVAIILASYSFISTQLGSGTAEIKNQLNNINSKVDKIRDRLSDLDQGIESDRQVLIQAELRKALLYIQGIARLAKGETQAKIAEIEEILQSITAPKKESAGNEQETSGNEHPAEKAVSVETPAQAKDDQAPSGKSDTADTPSGTTSGTPDQGSRSQPAVPDNEGSSDQGETGKGEGQAPPLSEF